MYKKFKILFKLYTDLYFSSSKKKKNLMLLLLNIELLVIKIKISDVLNNV